MFSIHEFISISCPANIPAVLQSLKMHLPAILLASMADILATLALPATSVQDKLSSAADAVPRESSLFSDKDNQPKFAEVRTIMLSFIMGSTRSLFRMIRRRTLRGYRSSLTPRLALLLFLLMISRVHRRSRVLLLGR